jgi:arsenite methyltransferase
LAADLKDMYRHVSLEQEAELHFEIGRGVAEHLGCARDLLDAIPAVAVASFAHVPLMHVYIKFQ